MVFSDLLDVEPFPMSPIPAVNVACVPQRSPLRYPSGKTWLIPHVRAWLGSLCTPPELLLEPFAGGAIVLAGGAEVCAGTHGDIIWMVVDVVPTKDGGYRLARDRWEVLTLERSCKKLLAAKTVQRDAFLQVLRSKLSTI